MMPTNSNLKPLTSHATPYTLARIQSVPPAYRKKSDWYRDQMDPLVENDTQRLHWSLSPTESRRLLDAIFPDRTLFPQTLEPSGSLSMTQLLDSLRNQGIYRRSDTNDSIECWDQFPSCHGKGAESNIAKFLNGVLKAAEKVVGTSSIQRVWHASGATLPLKGSDVNRKPDLILLPVSISKSSKELDWRDVVVFGEIKSKRSSDTVKKSYIEAAGKTALLLYTQDRRHSVPCLRILGHHIVVTFFDRGGSLSSAAFDIHENPEVFLRVLLGVSTVSMANIGFDETVFWDGREKMVLVAWKGHSESDRVDDLLVSLEQLIFISDALHGRGTTVWTGSMKDPTRKLRRRVVIKDSWIDPLRKFTEGNLLARLNDANVEGVPQLIHEQQVQGPDPSGTGATVNMSTHFLRALLSLSYNRPYQLRVLSRLVTEPCGISIMLFSSLAELLITFIDYVSIHKDAIKKAKVLHRDISLLNLLLVVWNSSGDGDRRLDFLDSLPQNIHVQLRTKMKSIVYHGLLGDWGYSVPLDVPSCALESTPPTSPLSSPPTSLVSSAEHQPSKMGDLHVPIHVPGQHKDRVARIPLSELRIDHDIVLSVGRSQLSDPSSPSIDTNPLYRTGTWSWMAAELVMAGPGKLVSHTASHDLESIFYVLLGICVLFDTPHRLKAESALSVCFDLYFNTSEPSLLKTVVIQSQLGWSFNILRHISPYFQPLVPLLNTLQEQIILPMDFKNNSFCIGSPITHDEMSSALIQALCDIDDEAWARTQPANHPDPQAAVNSGPSSETGPDLSDDASGQSEYDSWSEISDASIHSTPPRMLRLSSIREVSGPGFTSSTSSSSARRRLSDDADYPDPDSRATKRQCSAPFRFDAGAIPTVPPRGPLTRRFTATAPPSHHS